MFGLAQLYQLRGRVGRSKLRAYALLTLPASKPITPQAEAEARLVALRESFEPLRQTAANLVRHAERKGERFTTARTVDVEAVREALAGLGFA